MALSLVVTVFTGCSVVEQIAGYNLERLYEEKEEVVDTTIYLPESTYIKDTIELAMINPKTLNPIEPIDYSIDQVVGADIVTSYGGKVNVLSLQQGVSTTNIIDSIKSR